ncbi:hypothetical protein R1sor_014427 [Riccia sorocarpa]|uniref:Uncharacterized protein n=1 Tax=Riccia sorocarpa TaxID=122646 RepID=A0ABD3H9W1_9MARC
MTTVEVDARARAASLIRSWCEEKGTDVFVDQLLKLLDTEYLRTWGGLKHIPFPEVSNLGPSAQIPAKHWRTYGDPRYWGEELHQAIKALWPDRLDRASSSDVSAWRSVKRRPVRDSQSEVIARPRRVTTVSKFTFSPPDSKPFSCSVESVTDLSTSPLVKKKRRLPPWIYEPLPEVRHPDSSPAKSDEEIVGNQANSPLKSPVRLCIQQSPALHQPSAARSTNFHSLRKEKRVARSLEGRIASQPVQVDDPVDVICTPSAFDRIPPPSIRDIAKWKNNIKGGNGSGLHRRPVELKNVTDLPILQPPGSETDRPYVTRSLFGSVPRVDVGQVIAGPVQSNKNVFSADIVGVYMDVFTEVELAGAMICQPDYICCFLLDQFVDDVSSLEKVRVRLLHNEMCVETFRSCCEFDSRFTLCSNHISSDSSVVAGVLITQDEDPLPSPVQGTILSGSFDSDEESEWSGESHIEEAEESESDWESYYDEIVEEDLPRLGLLEIPDSFADDPIEWQYADENWPSNRTRYSHETKFLGPDPEPVPDWFQKPGDKDPVEVLIQLWTQ